jgi:hypothetical protein
MARRLQRADGAQSSAITMQLYRKFCADRLVRRDVVDIGIIRIDIIRKVDEKPVYLILS